MREDAMTKAILMISAFTLIFMVPASAQDGMRRGDQRFMAQQQRRDRYVQPRRREQTRDERRDTTLGAQPWSRTENWCVDARGGIVLCDQMRGERRDNTVLGAQPWWRTENWCVDARGSIFLCRQ
jgi:hypothetical protein